jgi:hypothetical protein
VRRLLATSHAIDARQHPHPSEAEGWGTRGPFRNGGRLLRRIKVSISPEVSGLVAEGRSLSETIEIAQSLARKIVESTEIRFRRRSATDMFPSANFEFQS